MAWSLSKALTWSTMEIQFVAASQITYFKRSFAARVPQGDGVSKEANKTGGLLAGRKYVKNYIK